MIKITHTLDIYHYIYYEYFMSISYWCLCLHVYEEKIYKMTLSMLRLIFCLQCIYSGYLTLYAI